MTPAHPSPTLSGARGSTLAAHARLLGTGLAGLLGIAVSVSLGDGALGTPPLRGPGAFGIHDWATDRSPFAMALAGVRIAVLMCSAWLVLVAILALLSGVAGLGRHGPALARTAERLLPRWARHWRDLAFAVTLSTASAALLPVGAASAAQRSPLPAAPRTTMSAQLRAGDPGSGQRWPDFDALEPGRPTTTARVLSTPTTTTTTTTTPTTTPTATTTTPTATTTTLTATTTTPTATTTTPTTTTTTPTTATTAVNPVASGTARRAATEPGPAAATSDGPDRSAHPGTVGADTATQASAVARIQTHVVRAGDSLWSIAERVVLRAQPGAGESEIAAYWVDLVVANRTSLRNPGDPDYLVPGDTVRVLPLEAGSAPD